MMRFMHTAFVAALIVMCAWPAQAASDVREVGYSAVIHGHVVRIASISEAALAKIPHGYTIAQVDAGPYFLMPVGTDGGIVVADAPVGTGSAQVGVSSVVNGGSGNLVCTTTSGAVTCDVVASPSVTSLTATGSSPLTLSNGSGTTTVASSTTGTLSITTVAGGSVDGVTLPTPSLGGRSVLNLGGNGTTTAALFCGGTLPCYILTTALMSTDVYSFDTTNTCTNANALFKVSMAGGFNFKVTCHGDATVLGSLTANRASAAAIIAGGNGGIVEATPTIGTNNITTEVLPAYSMSAGGTASLIGSTVRLIIGTCTFSSSTSCKSSTQAGGAAWGLAFTSAATFVCHASPTGTSGLVNITAQSTTDVSLSAASSNSSAVPYVCIGT